VGRVAKIGPTPQTLGQTLENRIGTPVRIEKAVLADLLRREQLEAVAERLARPVSRTAAGVSARYFVIHDTSQRLKGSTFPPTDDPRLNGLGTKHSDGTWVAHIFVNRNGKVLVAYDFEKPWRATRLEGRAGERSRGLFLHVEHNQPRLRDPKGPPDNDYDAPTIGFTPQQYDRSALLYITASTRAGRWLVPAYHAVIDKGVGSHDDPQNFDRAAWETALERRVQQLEGPASPIAQRRDVVPLRASLYYTALESDYPPGSDIAFRSRTGAVLHRGSQSFFDKAAIEGSAKLNDGRVINVDGTVDNERRWTVIPQAFGLDALGCALIPFRSAAVDRNVVALRTQLYLPETVGMRLPTGAVHDGLWYAVDVGSGIRGDRIDLFLGAGKATMAIPRNHGLGHLQALQAERRGSFKGCPPA
jgi:3D (Asp-Asp-Asp) domain-containing protein